MKRSYIFENRNSEAGEIEEVYYDEEKKKFVFSGRYVVIYASLEATKSIADGIQDYLKMGDSESEE